jgi:AcrR family transcriptional regulator
MSDLSSAMGIGPASLYATFGSKEQLYAEALDYYARCYAPLFWGEFGSAGTVREAVGSLLMNSAAALDGVRENIPAGCMVALSTVGSEGHERLGDLVSAARAEGLERLTDRLRRAVAQGEVEGPVDVQAVGRFIQAIYNGMSLLARDGATRSELEAIAQIALEAWDARVRPTEVRPS